MDAPENILDFIVYSKKIKLFPPNKFYHIFINFHSLPVSNGGHTVAQPAEVLRYKLKGRGFDFSLTQFFRPHYGPGVDSASNRNKYIEYFLEDKGGRYLGLTSLPPLCADCLKI
jgi:hypothetical protein